MSNATVNDIHFGTPRTFVGEAAGSDDLLVVYGLHQAREYPQFHSSQVITYLTPWDLKRLKPRRIFTTGLGISGHAWRFRAEMEQLAYDQGTEIYGVEQYEEVIGAEAAGVAYPIEIFDEFFEEELDATIYGELA